jgi:hypothetical protein
MGSSDEDPGIGRVTEDDPTTVFMSDYLLSLDEQYDR